MSFNVSHRLNRLFSLASDGIAFKWYLTSSQRNWILAKIQNWALRPTVWTMSKCFLFTGLPRSCRTSRTTGTSRHWTIRTPGTAYLHIYKFCISFFVYVKICLKYKNIAFLHCFLIHPQGRDGSQGVPGADGRPVSCFHSLSYWHTSHFACFFHINKLMGCLRNFLCKLES